MDKHGFVRITTASNKVSVGNPVANADEHIRIIKENPHSDIILFPETSITGYTCQKLFHQKALLDAAELQTLRIAREVQHQLVVVGLPFRVGNSLFNCAAVINDGNVIGVVPKDFIPNYNEFYEGRWFAPGSKAGEDRVEFGTKFESGRPNANTLGKNIVPFGSQLLFKHTAHNGQEVSAFVEICEAIWMPIPPSSFAAIAGANILLNPSASNETIGKPEYRRNLVMGQSGRCIAAYAYASCGPTESTSDLVFGGHCMIAEGGHLLKESRRVGDGETPERDSYWVTADVDVEKLQTERRTTTSYAESRKYLAGRDHYRTVSIKLISYHSDRKEGLLRHIDARPFVPKNEATLNNRCSEIFGIQTCALAKRLECLGPNPKVVIGVSGGLDSTLALMVACKTFDMLKIPRSNITGVTMPGFGTSDHTHTSADDLMEYTGITVKTIDIRKACLQEFKDLEHKPFGINIMDTCDLPCDLDKFTELISMLTPEKRAEGDLVFENVQARRRTEYLMNMGFVLGTGDMSELWLGWCTYNADQQSMYNVNAGVPKTLVQFLVRYIASTDCGETAQGPTNSLYNTLMRIADTTISPELLPTNEEGEIEQSTEDHIGPYELHDFFMFYLVRNGFTPEKVLYLAEQAKGWEGEYTTEDFKKWLRLNIKRAFQQQYKRDNIPNGPKVGSVALSPRGDWRMPPDADPAIWMENLK
mgnify:CR=1 FL=1|jgi:NAD+ synthase (glutamine-hydrolysing)